MFLGSRWWLALLGTGLLSLLATTNVRAEIKVDGLLDEAEWQQAQTLGPLVTVQPLTQTGRRPTRLKCCC